MGTRSVIVIILAQNVYKIKNVVVKRLTLIITTEKCRRLRNLFGFYVDKYLSALHILLPFTLIYFTLFKQTGEEKYILIRIR